MKLSALVITLNEEANIQRCLTSLSFADEVIVVDSGSTDKTVEYAKEKGARVFTNPWPGYGAQKNFAAEQAHGEWLLFIDADEEISTELQTDIKAVISSTSSLDFYWLKIVTIFLNKPLRHLYGHNLRLFRKSAGHWTADHVHEQVETTSKQRIRLGDSLSAVLPTHLLHHSHTTVRSYLHSMQEYTSLDAEQIKKTGKHRSGRSVTPTWILPWQLGFRQFLKLLIYRKGLLDGWHGFVWCVLSGYYEYVMARKYVHLCA